MEDVLREHINFSISHVVIRTGDTVKAEVLEKVFVKDARTMLVMSPAGKRGRLQLRAFSTWCLTMRSMKWPRDGTCVVEDLLHRNVLLFHETCYAILKGRYRVTWAANSLSRGVSIEASLVDEFYIQPVQRRGDCTFGQLLRGLPGVVAVGIRKPGESPFWCRDGLGVGCGG